MALPTTSEGWKRAEQALLDFMRFSTNEQQAALQGLLMGKVGKVMKEFKEGKLRSGSKDGPKVKNPKQAKAIALSEAREAGEKVASPKGYRGRIARAKL